MSLQIDAHAFPVNIETHKASVKTLSPKIVWEQLMERVSAPIVQLVLLWMLISSADVPVISTSTQETIPAQIVQQLVPAVEGPESVLDVLVATFSIEKGLVYARRL